jgi:hypothetical protein
MTHSTNRVLPAETADRLLYLLEVKSLQRKNHAFGNRDVCGRRPLCSSEAHHDTQLAHGRTTPASEAMSERVRKLRLATELHILAIMMCLIVVCVEL